ncbi:ornithine cyclodeaminase family protein [Desemzia sp. RIT804]|nr:ornithine cyclodeaminase family protein [Desemzia sp. RIT 804]
MLLMNLAILNEEMLSNLLDMPSVIKTVESVYKQKSNDASVVWDTIFYDFEPGKADMDIKSGFLKDQKIFGHKTVTWFGENTDKGLPTLTGLICVFDGNTGIPIGVTEGSYITGMRTGAAAAIGAKYLANPDSQKALIIGSGNQLKFQVAALLTVYPKLKVLEVYDRNTEKAQAAVQSLPEQMGAMGITQVTTQLKATQELKKSVETSQIIVTITPSKIPIIQADWVKPGTHLSTMGADMAGKQEIDELIFSKAVIVTDDLRHSSQVGEMETALKNKIISIDDIKGEIGDLILNKVTGRQDKDEVTIFDATGMALMDIATAKLAIDLSEKNNSGISVQF